MKLRTSNPDFVFTHTLFITFVLYYIVIILCSTNLCSINDNNFDRLQFSGCAKMELPGMRDGDIRALCQFFAAFEWSTATRTPCTNER